jgi:hypothetical protein
MGVSAATVWECRAQTGSDANGGGFVAGSGGTDRSQQNLAFVVIDNATITTSVTTNVITFTAGYTPTAADVGNLVQVVSGTNATAGNFFNITAQTATTWTVNGNVVSSGTTTNLVANMGGALATLATLATAMVASNKAYVTGAFTSNATITFAQASGSPTGAIPPTRLIGYGSVRGDSTQATLTLSTNTGLTGINATASAFLVEQIAVNCASLGTSTGISVAGSSQVLRCKVSNFTLRGIFCTTTNSTVADCEVTAGVSPATEGIYLQGGTSFALRNNVHDNANCVAIKAVTGCTVQSNVVTNNTGAAADGIQTQYDCWVKNNTCHANGRHGVFFNTNNVISDHCRDNIFTANGGYGFVGTSGTALPADPDYDGNAYWNNASGARSLVDSTTGIYGVNPYTNVRDLTLTGSPYVGPTTGLTANFGLNNVPGAGADCRGAGSPGTWPGLPATVGNLDMGAVQSQAPPAAGAGAMPQILIAA